MHENKKYLEISFESCLDFILVTDSIDKYFYFILFAIFIIFLLSGF